MSKQESSRPVATEGERRGLEFDKRGVQRTKKKIMKPGPSHQCCYSSSPLSWYLSLFRLPSHSYALWYVFLRLDTYSDSFEFIELFFYWTLTRAILLSLLPDGMIPVDSFMLTLILDSLVFHPILSYRTRTFYYSSIPSCSTEFYAYASPSISRQLHVLSSHSRSTQSSIFLDP